MKLNLPQTTAPVTSLQTVLDRLGADLGLSDTRTRDLRSAVISFAKLMAQPPATIPLDLADIRRTLDGMVLARAKISPKRWANLRSGLAAAIETSGLRPMLKTADLDLDELWAGILGPADRRVRNGLSRFGRWASLHGIRPEAVDDSILDRFVAELDRATLVRDLGHVRSKVARTWNALVGFSPAAGLRRVTVPANGPATQMFWERLPVSFPEDVEAYRVWASVPDPLQEGARARALAPSSLRLQLTHIRAAVRAAVAAGVPVDGLTSVSSLVEPETFRVLLRHRWREDGSTLSAFTHGLAVTLIAIATEWVKAPADSIATLKALRSKLGTLPTGLTDKNKRFLRAFEDPRLVASLIQLPDRLWHAARRQPSSRFAFIDLQTALAIDILIHVPLRLQNLASLKFDQHLHWPQGRRKPALLTFGGADTKNGAVLEFEIPTVLADRLQIYRDEIAPAVIGKRANAVFVSLKGEPKTHAGIKLGIEKAVLRHLGVKITPHQFRHLAAKIVLDTNPGAYELVRQLLGHKNLKTTTNFYAGIDTRRAGRAHADLVMKLREVKLDRRRHHRTPGARRD